jgi:hypothetical protein
MAIANIDEIAIRTYGFSILALDPMAALWLAESILKNNGKNVFKRISNHRNKYGKGTMFPAFGTELFNGI